MLFLEPPAAALHTCSLFFFLLLRIRPQWSTARYSQRRSRTERLQATSDLVSRPQACIVGSVSMGLLSHADGRGDMGGDEGEIDCVRPMPDIDTDSATSAQIARLHKQLKVTRSEVKLQSVRAATVGIGFLGPRCMVPRCMVCRHWTLKAIDPLTRSSQGSITFWSASPFVLAIRFVRIWELPIPFSQIVTTAPPPKTASDPTVPY